MNKPILAVIFLFVAFSGFCAYASSAGSRSDDIALQNHNDDSGDNGVEISIESQKLAGISVEKIKLKKLPIFVSAPGEVEINLNKSAIVSPRIPSQVLKRLVEAGQQTAKGTPLVLLTSVEMAEAQTAMLLASKQRKRFEKLGKNIVSLQAVQTIEVEYKQAISKLLAYGMTKGEVKALELSGDASEASGEFVLFAPREGTVFKADFTVGERIEPGQILYEIVNEAELWVNAQLSNGDSDSVKSGNLAIVKTAHEELPASVLQVHHQLNEETRTQLVRLLVKNPEDRLHPGEFVTCEIQVGTTEPVLAVPISAIVRTPDGDQGIYIETKPNHFKLQEVEVVQSLGGIMIINGIKPDSNIVIAGAFFVHSESLKSGFTVHNH